MIFIIPIGLLFVFPAWVYILSREYYSLEDIVNKQIANPKIIYGSAYNSFDEHYKQLLLSKIDPLIVVLGSSRSLGFKKDFFLNPDRFFVAGYGGNMHSADNLNWFASKGKFRDSKVKFIILSLDPAEFIFNPLG